MTVQVFCCVHHQIVGSNRDDQIGLTEIELRQESALDYLVFKPIGNGLSNAIQYFMILLMGPCGVLLDPIRKFETLHQRLPCRFVKLGNSRYFGHQ